MSVTASDIKFYMSENRPSGDTGTVGGAIDTTFRALFDDYLLANTPSASGGDGTLRYESTNNADNGVTINVYGRNAAGSLVEESKNVGNSGVDVTGTQVFERILWASTDDHDYDLKVNDSAGNNILTIESGVTGVMRPFVGISSSPSEDKIYYSKVYVKNTNETLALLNAVFIENSGGVYDKMTYALEDAQNDNGTSTNRLTAPDAGTIGASGFSSDNQVMSEQLDAATADLGPGSGLGVWLKIVLPSGESAQKSYYSLGVSGETI